MATMIWFACSQCGKTHGRPDTSVGTMIFCDCGQGNTVPWESTASEPAAVPVIDVPISPPIGPVTFDTPPATAPLPTPPRLSSSDEEEAPRRRRGERRDPDFCFNHQRTPRAGACADCGESFCSDCLVELQGAALCGPCKNFRARRLELPPISSTQASISLLLALIAGPLALCLIPYATVLSLLALVPLALAIGLGVWALRASEKDARIGGQSLAITGIATAAVMSFLTVLLHYCVAGSGG